MFTLDGAFFFHIDTYQGLVIPDGTPTRTIELPAESQPDIISLDEIFHMKVLCVQCEEKLEGGSSKWSFVEM